MQLVYPLKRQVSREAFSRMIVENFPNLRGNIEYQPNKVVITFIHDITNAEAQRLNNLVARLNKADSDWLDELKDARKVDRANRQVIYRGTVPVGTIVPYDARGRLLSKKLGMLLDDE